MKQKILFALLAAVCLVGCGSEDEQNDLSKDITDMELVGHYICTDFEFRYMENGKVSSNGKNVSDPVEINADHTFAVDEMINGKVLRRNKGTWKRDGSEVSFTYDNSLSTNTGTFTYKNKVIHIAGTTSMGYFFNIRLVKQ